MQAFCVSVATATASRAAAEDRRLAKAHLSVHIGGIEAAIEAYHTAPTPNVIMLETDGHSDILDGLDELAGVCDAGTRVVVIGTASDITPIVSWSAAASTTTSSGRSNRSTSCARSAASRGLRSRRRRPHHRRGRRQGRRRRLNRRPQLAWQIARDLALDSVVIDLDLAFGTASLDYNQDPVQGIANAVFSPERPDSSFMERLLAKCTDHLSLLAAPATLDQVYDFGADAFDAIFDTMRMTTPCIVLDVPHQWTAWTSARWSAPTTS